MFVLLPLHSEDYRSHNPLQNNIIDNLILEESILHMNMYICTVCLPVAMFFLHNLLCTKRHGSKCSYRLKLLNQPSFHMA